MFGLENKKKGQIEEFVFELEKDLKDPKKRKKVREQVENRIQQIKNFLRSGKNKEDFDTMGVVLHGYTALLKVMTRFGSEKS